ncbi:phospho-N-acetylmuramoyl-pentapeptide-transferase [Friedmanniella endophytica]|uniref:Phospho-N-acetylmuramoyl-pentapeptide-transferase n=1 Tax=Microlunatus kandeliicorticis TaxID=1759536 RepID=A0A7W3P5N4_9ACTN|nr:phospho-N-acetylmuramoyl-pentapeptide-transferase [Microlunatus kandeliicorticis]MBA8794176.1 phospho-N-acetylmuramoyl-pentapeptide-transferase [Microlunatus kandeliicorticis]
MIAILVAAATALLFTLFLTPLFVRLFQRLGWGQRIRVDGPTSHHTKAGTPTKGGIVFLSGAVVGYFAAHLFVPNTAITASGLLALFLTLGLALVGFLDDYTKTRRDRSLGLTGWQKIGGQVVVASVFAVLARMFPEGGTGIRPASTAVSVVGDVPWLDFALLGPVVGLVGYVLWVNLLSVAASNAVNVTDGLDGLAAGASIIALSVYVLITLGEFRRSCAVVSAADASAGRCYGARDPLDLAIFAAALALALAGYLWWSAPPARIFMGDVGSLGLGGALAALAILSRTELLLVVIGGLFCATTGSVIIQRAYFKITGGKRIFRMSPLHHHFELLGWPEPLITIRFWLIGGICGVAGLLLFYLGRVLT